MKIDLVFLIILGFMVLKTVCSNKINNKEHMDDTSTPSPTISAAMIDSVKLIYNTDVTTIQKLIIIATDLQKDKFACRGKLTVTEDFIVSGKANVAGFLNTRFITNESNIDNDWLRIGCNSSTKADSAQYTGVGTIAMYGGVCINGVTADKSGAKYSGLTVGSFSNNIGSGNITATGIITGAQCIIPGVCDLKDLYTRALALKSKYAHISSQADGIHITGDVLLTKQCCLTTVGKVYAFGSLDQGICVLKKTNPKHKFPYWKTTVGDSRNYCTTYRGTYNETKNLPPLAPKSVKVPLSMGNCNF